MNSEINLSSFQKTPHTVAIRGWYGDDDKLLGPSDADIDHPLGFVIRAVSAKSSEVVPYAEAPRDLVESQRRQRRTPCPSLRGLWHSRCRAHSLSREADANPHSRGLEVSSLRHAGTINES